MKPIRYAVIAAALLAAIAAAPAAQAADPHFCDNYAHTAVRQSELAQRACANGVNTSEPRWSPNFRLHYDWCLGAPYVDAKRERESRKVVINRCRHY